MRSESVGAGTGVTGLQWRLGALYLPNKQLSDGVEMFMYSKYAHDKLRGYNSPDSVSLADWSDADRKAVFAVNLEKSTVVGLSGLPMNNSRRLQCNLTFQAGANRTIYIWLQYLRVATCNLDHVKVSE